MQKFKRLPTGIIVMSQKGHDGVIRYTTLNQKKLNIKYMYCIWWSRAKELLKNLNIITWENQNH